MHTHIIPPAVIAAGENRLFGMHAEAKTLHICAHGVPMHPLSKVDALVERIKSDGLDGAIVSVPPPLFRPDLGSNDRTSYTRLVNDSLLAACRSHEPSLRPFAYLPIEDPELATDVASRLDTNWAGAVAGTDLGLLSYASERYDALWQTLSDAKLPLFIHPGSSPDTRLDPFYLSNLLGNPCRDDDRRGQPNFRWRHASLPRPESNSRSWRWLCGRIMRALAARFGHQPTGHPEVSPATVRSRTPLLCRQSGTFAKLSSGGH